MQAAKKQGLSVSCDLNFRKKLWKWKKGVSAETLARETMPQLLSHVDLVIANEEDAELALGIHAAATNVEAGTLNVAAYTDVAKQIVGRFANVRLVAITLRESISASHNNWGGLLYDAASGRSFVAPCDASGNYKPYEIRNIVDRVGAGDSFAGALIFSLALNPVSKGASIRPRRPCVTPSRPAASSTAFWATSITLRGRRSRP